MDEERWRSLHEVKLIFYIYCNQTPSPSAVSFYFCSGLHFLHSHVSKIQSCQDDSELDAAAEEVEKRSQGSAQIGLNYANLEPGAEVEGNTFGPEYKWVATSWNENHSFNVA